MNPNFIHFDVSLTPELQARWHAFWSNSAHAAPRQNHQYGDIERDSGHRVIYVWAENDGDIAFVGIFCLSQCFVRNVYLEAVCWRGPVFDDAEFAGKCLAQIRTFFSTMNIGSLRIGPRWLFPEAAPVESMLEQAGYTFFEKSPRRSTGLIDIHRSDSDLLSSFSKSTRQQVRLAQRAGIVVRAAATTEDASTFFYELSKMHRDRGISMIPKNEFFSTFSAVWRQGDYGIILNAFWNDQYMGGILLTRDAQTAYAFKMVIVEQADGALSTIRLAPFLFFEGMRWAREKGCKSLDVEGYRSDIENAGHLAYIYQYKKGFRPTEVQTLSQYTLRINRCVFLLSRLDGFIRRAISIPQRIKFKINKKILSYKLSAAQRRSEHLSD